MNLPAELTSLTEGLNWAWIAAGATAIATFWSQLKGMVTRFNSLFIVTTQIESDAKEALIYYLFTEFTKSPLSRAKYGGWKKYVRPVEEYQVVGWELLAEKMTFFDGKKPLFTSLGENNGDLTISFLRGTFDLTDLVTKAIDSYNILIKKGDKGRKRYIVRKRFGKFGSSSDKNREEDTIEQVQNHEDISLPLKWKKEDLGPKIKKNPFSSLYYDSEIKEFINSLRIWRQSEKFFKDRNLAWRFGGGLFGPPGTGKSSLVRAIAQEFDFPVDHYDLTSMSNEEFTEYWSKSLNSAPCIVLLEDMDRVFHGDKMVGETGNMVKGRLTMDCILNCINGVESSDGIITFVTANDASKLDIALGIPDKKTGKSTRPGRLDKMVFFKVLEEEQRQKIAESILDWFPDLISKTVKEGENETGAQFEKRCADIAVEEFWKLSDKEKEILNGGKLKALDSPKPSQDLKFSSGDLPKLCENRRMW